MKRLFKKKEVESNDLYLLKNEIMDEVNVLKKKINALESDAFKSKYPSGKLELSYPNFMSLNRSIMFTYSFDGEIHTVNIKSSLRQYDFYKIVVDNNKAFIGFRFDDLSDDVIESYHIVNFSNKTVIHLHECPTNKLNTEKWIKCD